MSRRIRAALVTVSTAPWRRAPLLLRRRPGVLATVAGACAVMAASVASVPLFLSSIGTESVTLQAGERCPRDTGVTLASAGTPGDVAAPPADPFRPLAGKLGPANRWARVETISVVGADVAGRTEASLIARDDALDHVDVLEGSDGPGVWLTDRAAERTGLRAGGTATVSGVEVPVAGIYRDLAGTTVDDYWCSHADMLLVEVRGGDLVPPPPLLIADRATFAAVMAGLDARRVRAAWEAPLGAELTLGDTERLIQDLACRTDVAPTLAWCADGQPLVWLRNGPFRADPFPAEDDDDFVERYFLSHLPFVTDRSVAIQTSVAGGIWPVAGFATLAGVGLVAAAASLWFDRRRREVTLLTVRGVSPAALGAKAVLELSIPSMVGAVAGIGLAYGTVVWLGPSPLLERSAVLRAAGGAAVALLVGAITVGAVVARRVRSHDGRHDRRIGLAALPWEVLLGWVTLVSYERLGDWGLPVGRGATVTKVDVWGLLFPVLFLVTGVAVLSRVLSLALRPLRAMSRTWPTALYLAVRRVARFRVAVLGLVAAAAVAAGVLGYAATMNRSLRATLQVKAATFVGSDMAVRIPADDELPDAVAARATDVRTYARAWVDDDGDGDRESVTVLVIDPATFERAAFWDATFADASLGEILERLAAPAAPGRAPAVVVGMDLDGPVQAGIVEGTTRPITLEPIPGVRAFPGMKRSKPTVYVVADAITDLELGRGTVESWITGDRDDTEAALVDAGIAFGEIRRLDEVAAGSAFLTVSWTFGFMQSLGISAGFLVLGGVAVYLDARRRDRLLGYAFMRRMGLSSGQHRRALAVELTASVLVGCWVGLAIALVAAWSAHGRIDPVPGFDPSPVLRPAGAVIVALAATSLVLTGLAAALAQRRIDRDDPVEVLRAGV